jgi:hypothetical protein
VHNEDMIPPLGESGVLPPDIHEAEDWAEVAARFGGTPQRVRLLTKLRRGLDNLRDAGCPWVLLDGSFVTSKPEPNDVDGCWEDAPTVDRSRLDRCFLPRSVAEKLRQKAEYGMDFYRATSFEAESGKSFLEFFQSDRDGRDRGIVRLNLAAELLALRTAQQGSD